MCLYACITIQNACVELNVVINVMKMFRKNNLSICLFKNLKCIICWICWIKCCY